MHEFSLAQSIAEQASEAAEAEGATHVNLVRLRIGYLSGISNEVLESCWQITTENSILKNSRLEIENVPVTLYCGFCKKNVLPRDYWIMVCPECDTLSNNLRSGRELELVSLEYT